MWAPSLSDSDKPLYQQIVDAMAADIASGKLAIGEKLPPQRQLAWHLDINLSTVTKAFHLAAQQHLIAGEVGRGTYILGQSVEAELFLLNQAKQPKGDTHDTSAIIDLSTHIPATKVHDHDLENAISAITKAHNGLSTFLDYHSPSSLAHLQMAASTWLNQNQYKIPADRCVITNTAQNALMVSLMASCQKDDVVLVNELTFPGMKAIAKQLHLKLYGVKTDQQGIIPEALDLAIRSTGARVLVSDSTFQNPTGACMSAERQTAFINVLKRHNLLFIEEFVMGMLAGAPPVSGAIQTQSILISSFAKTVSPGIRFATIAGKHPILETVAQESHATSWQMSPLMAEVARHWINEGIAEQRKQWQINEIAKRYRIFKQVMPELSLPTDSNGCSHVWLPTLGDAKEAAIVLEKKGVRVVPSHYFAVNHQFIQAVRVSLTAAKSRQQLKIGLERIKGSGVLCL
ncbi:PLP-dependent aminotransferase family protein [Thalassotalea euphylliae]|uniref:aminotransferase-like domain-containing protein n=1 Tax=Thalassotalea euphylliae TaxID=1655234 RepID=UPI00362934ED